MTNFQDKNNGCLWLIGDNNTPCGKPTFAKIVKDEAGNRIKKWKCACPQHEADWNKPESDDFWEDSKSDFAQLAEAIMYGPSLPKSEPSISELEAQLQELQAKLNEAKVKEAERIRLEELKNPVIITVIDITTNDGVIIKLNKTNEDVLRVLRNTRGRFFDSYTETNIIPILSWFEFRDEIAKLESVKIKENKKLDEIEVYINEKDVSVDITEKVFNLIVARRKKQWVVETIVNRLPGAVAINPTQEIKNTRINVPLSEGWRIADTLDYAKKVSYIDSYVISNKANEIIIDQIESRNKLDGAAQLLDVENFPDLELNGQTLRPFQKVGVRFAVLALGLGDISND